MSRPLAPDMTLVGCGALLSQFRFASITVHAPTGELAAGDLDGDGLPDLLAADQSGPNEMRLLALWGKGGADFTDPGQAVGGTVPLGRRDLQLADLDGDGRLDVVESVGGGLSVLRNLGARQFAARTQLGSRDGTAVRFTIADFDEDGLPDLLGVGERDLDLQWWKGRGAGRFDTARYLFTVRQAEAVTVWDFDEDGHLDVLGGGDGGGDPVLYFGDGHGLFARSTALTSGPSGPPSASLVVDLDGDRHPDLVWALRDQPLLGVALNRGRGTFAPASFVPVADAGAILVVAADFDGAPGLDLLAENANSSLNLLLNRGNATFAPLLSLENFHVTPHPTSIAVADFNADHRPDIALFEDGELHLHLDACP